MAILVAAGLVAVTAAQPPPANDNCATAIPIAGDGTFPFDTTAATGGLDVLCPPSFAITEDVWYCWTATRTGVATISTCGQTTVNTHIAIYVGCACDANGRPTSNDGQPLCCSDDDCELQSVVTCDVVCDQQYLIQIGQPPRNPPWPAGSGTFRITTTGTPCDPPCEVVCPTGGVLENEPGCGPGYIDQFNGGCVPDLPTPTFFDIECGQTICGRSGAWVESSPPFSLVRVDSDWYRFTLSECQRVTWCVEAEFAVGTTLWQVAPGGICTDRVYIEQVVGVTPCDEICISRQLQPGTYLLEIFPELFGATSLSCESDYVARLTCAPCCPPGECCGGTPRFTSFAGPVSVTTTLDLLPGAPQVQFVDLANSSSAPPGANWAAAPFATPDPSWSRANLGNVFGVAIDSQGDVYVAHSSVYGSLHPAAPGAFLDAVGVGGAGAIYKIAGTGVAAPWVTLPNTLDPIIAALSGYANEAWPGLGNIAIDCSRNTLFATNFDDGRIYRISLANSMVLSAFDHATNTVRPGGAPEPGDAPGFVPRGERVWAVEPHDGRIYYSIWGSDRSQSVAPNTIWSIQCDPSTGEFLPGTRRQEVLTFSNCPSPFADIAFTPSGSMLLAQRSMGASPGHPAADTLSWAHESCLLEFVCGQQAGQWDPSPSTFEVGAIPRSAAGGVDVDYRSGESYSVYATGDALQFPSPLVYGLQGLPATGGVAANSLLLDLDLQTTAFDKTQIGSVEISCPSICTEIVDVAILCEVVGTPPALTGNYTYTFTFTNNTSPPVPIQYLFTPSASGVTFNGSPPPGHSLALTNPVLPGATSLPITVTIAGALAGEFCFDMTFGDPNVDICCRISHCVNLPECDCVQFPECTITCIPGTNDYSMTFTVQNLFAPGPLDELHIFPLPIGSGVTPNPADFYFPSIPVFGVGGPFTTVITGASPGPLCMRISVHLGGELCCSEVKCVTLPDCRSPACGCDLDRDGDVDLADLATLLSNFGTPSGASPGDGDSDGDGDIDLQDLSVLLSYFGASCP